MIILSLLQLAVKRSATYSTKLVEQSMETVVKHWIHKKDVAYAEITDPITGRIKHVLDPNGAFKQDTLAFILQSEIGQRTVFTRADRVFNMPPSGITTGCKVFVNNSPAETKGADGKYVAVTDKNGNPIVNSEITFSMDNPEFRRYYVS